MMSITSLFLLFLLAQNDSINTEPMETIAYAADSLVFNISTENLSLLGTASLDHKQMGIEADTIRYSPESETVNAHGNVNLKDGSENATGEALIYHIPTATARTFATTSFYDDAEYNSATVTMLSRDEFNLTDVMFTSCDKDTFDYYFWADMMKVFPDDKAVAKPVILYIQDTPVFWLPYAVFPIRRGRSSGFTIPTIGSSGRDGRYIRKLGYYFGFSDYIDLLINSDLMEKTRFQITITERHNLRYVMAGSNRIQWRRQFENSRDRWLIESAHTQELPDGTMVKMTGNFVSDRSYLEESQQTPQERMQGQLRSWLSVSRTIGRGSFQANTEYIEYLNILPDTIDNETLSELIAPSMRFNLPSSPLFKTPADPADQRFWHNFYWNLNSNYLSEKTEWEDSSQYNSGIRLSSSLSAANRLGGILSISPSITTTGTAYNRDRFGKAFPGWLHSSVGLALSTNIYGMFSSNIAGYTLLRHSISPSISLSWAPDTYYSLNGEEHNIDEADSLYYSFGGFSLPSSGTSVNFSLLNTLEGKRLRRGIIERKSFAELALSSSWNPDASEMAFSPITGSLNLTPSDWLSTRINSIYNPYSGKAENLSLTSSVQLAGTDPTMQPDTAYILIPLSWRLNLSHNWTPALYGEENDLNKLRLSLTLDMSTRWGLNYRAYYDVEESDFISHDYSIMRDLDSWEAVFTRHVSNIDTGFYFRINIKAFPDIKVEQHTSSF